MGSWISVIFPLSSLFFSSLHLPALRKKLRVAGRPTDGVIVVCHSLPSLFFLFSLTGWVTVESIGSTIRRVMPSK